MITPQCLEVDGMSMSLGTSHLGRPVLDSMLCLMRRKMERQSTAELGFGLTEGTPEFRGESLQHEE